MNGQTTIYALADPNSGEVRYIGKTSQRLERRRTGHAVDVRRHDHRTNWIRSLGQPPAIRALMVVPNELASAAEVFAIAIYRSKGYRLTNVTNGGEGAPGAKRSAEFKEKVRTFQKGRIKSLKTRERLRVANIGKKMSVEAKAKNGASKKGNKYWVGKHHREETKEKIRQIRLDAAARYCPKGHEFTLENTYVRPAYSARPGHRKCRVCNKEYARAKAATRRKVEV